MASERVVLTVADPDGEQQVALSSPNKVIWPVDGGDGITKAEYADYVQQVSVPFLAANGERPVSLERFRDGIGSGGLVEEQPAKGNPR